MDTDSIMLLQIYLAELQLMDTYKCTSYTVNDMSLPDYVCQ